ncbi:phage terminase large subunit [Flavobacterium sp. UMI-01]|uniref:phage terminase large subunit n=1 Tax=Flavobacterium sp. UMI-01 TaxID=1441053 RepID=UPI001C7DA5F4|nr:phage terminase large subunit [Flavobacterium sp. UMI-01]GIZ08363.1 hypothetical protein FUMI01_10900 [Flavobacterium sp. UMI-01]
MEAIAVNEAKKLKVAKVKCLKSILFHTRYFFMEQYKRKFVVNSHHEQVCNVLEQVLTGNLVKVIINIAPRYSKTELAVKNFISHALALNPASRYIHLSFSDSLALDNSEAVKDILKLEKYRMLFPDVEIKKGSDSKKKWYTTAGGGVYATSTAGQVTGFGAGAVDKENEDDNEELDLDFIETKEEFAGALIIDDPIKPEDAESETKRERINARYDSTIKNRVNSRKTPIIIMGQRTHPNDLSGYVMESDGFTTDLEEAKSDLSKWFLLSIPVIQEDENGNEYALWEFKHSLEELRKMEDTNKHVFGTQYMQNPQPKEGLMYDTFKTYTHIPATAKTIRKAYIDVADKGKDNLCSIVYDELEHGCYVLDVLYTNLPMRDTQPMTAMQQAKFKVNICRVESNNGGEGFATEVEKQTRILKNHLTTFKTFHQGDNKEVRIFNNSAKVNNLVYMPVDWKTRWPHFYKHVTNYLKSGKNSSDDAEDCLTGVVEYFGEDKLTTGTPAWAGVFR